jgi:signal transduction histidine kinase
MTLLDSSAVSADSDLGTILTAWNTATERLQQTHELLRAEVKRLTDELEAKNHELARKNRLADLGQMASHVAHEVRNGLVPLKLYLNLLRRRVAADEPSLEITDKLGAGFGALEKVVNDLLQFTSHREPQVAHVAIPALIGELCDALSPQFAAQEITVVQQVAPDAACVADADMLRRAVLNLLLNALDVMPGGGSLTISATQCGHDVSIIVADTGPGLSEEVAQRLFEPFFTTKRSGTGLGLAIVERIAELHGRSIRARNHASGGAEFILTLPAVEAPSHLRNAA